MLGDQSESVWSDSDLNEVLNRSNIRIWRRIASEDPGATNRSVDYTYPADSSGISIVGASAGFNTGTSVATDVNAVISLEKVFYKTGGSTSFIEMPIGSPAQFNEISSGTSSAYDMLGVLPHLMGGYAGFLGDGRTKLLVRPVPSTELTIRLFMNTELAEDALSADGSGLLNGENLTFHEAVIYDAGFLCTFKDESIREEFMSMREDVMSMLSMQATSIHEAY
jgi:hypothetical protein